MKVSRRLAHKINSDVQVATSLLEELQLKLIGVELAKTERIRKILIDLATLVQQQTVKTVDNCEACGARRTILEMKRKKTQ